MLGMYFDILEFLNFMSSSSLGFWPLALLRHPDCVQVSIYLDAAEGQTGYPRMTQQYIDLDFRRSTLYQRKI